MQNLTSFTQAVKNGHQEMTQAGEMWQTYGFVIIGNLLQWLWQILDSAAKGGVFDFGPLTAIIARILLSLIAGVLIIASLWPKLKGIEKPYRFILAIAAGFFAEAFIGPPVNFLTASITG
jgi:hypothetical protein